MLDYALEMTFFTAQIFLTAIEQITKYCLRFLATNDRYCAAGFNGSCMTQSASHIGARTIHCIK
jgi:hypothetical protein